MSDIQPFPRPDSREDDDGPVGGMPNTATVAYAGRSLWLARFDRFASRVTRWAGTPTAFCVALMAVAAWALCGPLFKFSENWQLVINTGTTIVTFLMVFLIQQSQNKDSVAVHLKLDELLATSQRASNRMIGIEALDEQELQRVAAFYARLAERAKAGNLTSEAAQKVAMGRDMAKCAERSESAARS